MTQPHSRPIAVWHRFVTGLVSKLKLQRYSVILMADRVLLATPMRGQVDDDDPTIKLYDITHWEAARVYNLLLVSIDAQRKIDEAIADIFDSPADTQGDTNSGD